MADEQEQVEQFIEVYDEQGNIVKCEIYDVIDFEDKTYAMLLPLDTDEEDDDAEVIVMEYIEEGDEAYFKNVEDDNEFQRVCEYIESLEDEYEDEE